jgi:hypothetical protein
MYSSKCFGIVVSLPNEKNIQVKTKQEEAKDEYNATSTETQTENDFSAQQITYVMKNGKLITEDVVREGFVFFLSLFVFRCFIVLFFVFILS